MGKDLRVILVEDSDSDAALLLRDLQRAGYDVVHERVQTAQEMEAALDAGPWDIVLSDYHLPQFDARVCLDVVRASGVDVPVIIVSGTVGEDTAVEALHAGASDFLLKGRLARLGPAIDRELREKQDRDTRRRVEEALRQSEQRYRQIIETTNEGVWTLDSTLKTVFVNRRMAAMLGTSEAEMIGRPILDFVREDSRADVQRDFDRRRSGVPGHTEAILRRKDGSGLSVLLDSAPMLDASGAYEGALAVVMDISQRKRLEEQLRQAQKMEAVGRLAGGVAHDFNNILSVILSYADLILESVKTGDPLRPDVEEIRAAGQRATDLTRQLLAFSRQQVLQPTTLRPQPRPAGAREDAPAPAG